MNHDVAPRGWLRGPRGRPCNRPWYRGLLRPHGWPSTYNRTVPTRQSEDVLTASDNLHDGDLHLDLDLDGLPHRSVRLRYSVLPRVIQWGCRNRVGMLRISSCVLPTQIDQCQRGKILQITYIHILKYRCVAARFNTFLHVTENTEWREIDIPEMILGLRPTNERRCYFVTTSFIGWAPAWKQPPIRTWHPLVNITRKSARARKDGAKLTSQCQCVK